MNISENGINLIKQFEGCKLTAYKASKNEKYYTIGYGHYGADVTKGMEITQEEADALLKADLKTYENRVLQYYNIYHWNQNEFDALTSFAYNVGSIRQLTNNGRRTRREIAEKIPAYNKSGGNVLKGLIRRREAEKTLFLTPDIKNVVNYTAIAKDVIAGTYGNGTTRRVLLTAHGYDYNRVQTEVNRLLKEARK